MPDLARFEALSTADSANLLDRAPILVWRSGPDAHRDYFNDTWLRFTGARLEEEIGQGWMRRVHPEDLQRCSEIFLDPLRRLAPFEVEYRLRRHDGVYRWILERGVPVREEEAVRGFIGAGLDIHDRRRGEDSREAALRMMAHELRTPLQAVKIQVELMRRSAAAGEAFTPEMFDRFDAQFDRFGRLIGELLQTGDDSGMSIHRVRTDLAALLRRVVELRAHELRDAPGQNRHRLSFRGPEHADIEGDAARLEQAFVSLVDNSLKFSPRGGAVDVELRKEPGAYRVTIRDEGVGIPEEDLASVGRRFFRASNAPRRNFPGLGLGLATARGIFERHGGALTVASEPNHGTLVTVTLPPLEARP